jgi:hypothetical protein
MAFLAPIIAALGKAFMEVLANVFLGLLDRPDKMAPDVQGHLDTAGTPTVDENDALLGQFGVDR